MLNILTTNTKILLQSIAIGTILSICTLPLKAQTNSFQNIETETSTDWSFPSEAESISIKDDLKELEGYSISESELEENIELKEDDRKWGNRGDVEDLSLEAEVYNY